MRVMIGAVLALLSLLFWARQAVADDSAFLRFDEARLESGRSLWLENCKGCHAFGTAGAPIPMQPDEWRSRVIKDRAVLYDHAINGFFGPDDTMMPERGGNPDLTDEQLKQAVDYMVELANYYIRQQAGKNPIIK